MVTRKSFLVAVAAAVMLSGSVALGAGPEAAEAKPLGPKVPASAALKQIPAGCMGFVVVNNVNGMCGKVDEFLKSIGPGGQPFLPMSVLDLIRAQMRLGEGFNSNGPFVVAMLDPQQYGVDLIEMLRLRGVNPPSAPEVPAVILIPGKDRPRYSPLARARRRATTSRSAACTGGRWAASSPAAPARRPWRRWRR